MSNAYDTYIAEHKAAVASAFNWIEEKLPDILLPGFTGTYKWNTCFEHDESKYLTEEYDAYDNYFYGNKSYEAKKRFDQAWLHHIHANPHHWQHWILFEDDPTSDKPYKALDMPDAYIVEMICDWWSFSFRSGDLYEIFKWYDDHKKIMILSDKTRDRVEYILDRINTKLDEEMEKEDENETVVVVEVEENPDDVQ